MNTWGEEMETVKKTNQETKKDWLERECEQLGITYLGELKLPKKQAPGSFYSGLPKARSEFVRQG